MTESIVARLRAILTADTGDFKSDMQAAGKTVKDFSKESGEAQKSGADFGKMFSDLSKGVAKGTAAFASIGVTMKKAFDLGAAGAEVIQTTESFEMLLDKVGAAPDLLDKLQRASNYTIDKMSLMSATAALLAGTSGEMATALANNTPQLMEIAKAANKLNPALGTTADMYDSIALGIKRGSPMILDNLGLTIKVGEANQRMADSLGVSVDALTAEQKQMALLNDVMRAGDALINQVGGSTDAATDNIARMEASMKNAGDAAKELFAKPMANAADAIFYLIEGTNLVTNAYEKHNAEMAKTADTYEEYIHEMVRSSVVAGLLREDLAEQMEQAYLTGDATQFLMDAWGILDEETVKLQFDTRLLGEDMATTTDRLDLLTESEFKYGATTEEIATAMYDFANSLGETDEATDEYSETVDDATDSQEDLNKSLGETKSKLDGINTSIGSTIEKYKEQIAFFASGGMDLVKFTEDIMAAWDAGLISSEEAQGYLGEAGVAAVDLDMELGKIDPEEAVERLMALGIGPEEAKTRVAELQASLYALTSQKYLINITTRYETIGLPSDSYSSTTGGDYKKKVGGKPQRRASGGETYPGEAYLVGEDGPELFMSPTAGTIVPNHKLDRAAGNRSVIINNGDTNIYNPEAMLVREAYSNSLVLHAIRNNMG